MYSGFIDITRVLFCFAIIQYHSFLVGNEGKYAFSTGYLFVNFFFFLTGFLTYKHFDKQKEKNDIYIYLNIA